jgi:hypothetical protein
VAWGEFCFTLAVTDIATGWTVNPSGRAKWVFEALEHVVERFPLPIRGSTPILPSLGFEFINEHQLTWWTQQITFTVSPWEQE